MSIFERLPQEDVQQLWRYIDNYCDGSALPRERMDFFLRYWNSNKEDFFHMFGDEFIIKKEIYFEKPMDELEEEMDNAVRWGDYLIQDFCREFKHSLELIFKNDDSSKWELQAMVDSMYMLATNEYRGESIVIPGQYTKNGRALLLHQLSSYALIAVELIQQLFAPYTSSLPILFVVKIATAASFASTFIKMFKCCAHTRERTDRLAASGTVYYILRQRLFRNSAFNRSNHFIVCAADHSTNLFEICIMTMRFSCALGSIVVCPFVSNNTFYTFVSRSFQKLF